MSESERPSDNERPSDDELRAAVQRLDRIVGSFESEPNANVRERALELLEAVDAVHRPLVWAIGEWLWARDEELFRSLLDDPHASVLFELYGIVSPSRRTENAETPAGYVAVDDLLRTIPPAFGWRRAASGEEVPVLGMLARTIDGTALILTRSGGEISAYRDACPGSSLAISGGRVADGIVICPWHGCRYRLATGERVDREGPSLDPVPTETRDGDVRVGLRGTGLAA